MPGCDADGAGTNVKRSDVGTRGLDNLNMLATESLSYLTRSNKPYAVSVATNESKGTTAHAMSSFVVSTLTENAGASRRSLDPASMNMILQGQSPRKMKLVPSHFLPQRQIHIAEDFAYSMWQYANHVSKDFSKTDTQCTQ